MISSYAIRHATAADVALIARHRRSMFRDMGEKDEAKLADLEARTVLWTEQRINAGDYVGLLAVAGDGAVSSGDRHVVGGLATIDLEQGPTRNVSQRLHRARAPEAWARAHVDGSRSCVVPGKQDTGGVPACER